MPFMSEQASQPEPPLGWIITVATPGLGGGASSLEIYYVAISDQIDALDAVKAIAGAAQGTMVVAHQEISKSLMAALSLKPGDVSQL
jgi:hypothetical protein